MQPRGASLPACQKIEAAPTLQKRKGGATQSIYVPAKRWASLPYYRVRVVRVDPTLASKLRLRTWATGPWGTRPQVECGLRKGCASPQSQGQKGDTGLVRA